ncbi:chromodomain-helicase-DNA-binding protein 1-like [Panicum miliaceum]|uniref:Chromodomain-helicase-DNA-binding protein 1-like n=1 Tax=Panicum miliaceum TaxID=4540 RepID=A0A3L6R1X2_PANMI|nr:chromodomain-helicase-DNA-binding protein 1-like [Panicum miliaceum]
MDAAGAAAKFRALDAELAAKSSRAAELEARVSLLEAENVRLREALARGEATGRAAEGDPKFGRFATVRRGSEKPGKSVACDVIEVSDNEEGAAVDANSGRSPGEGVVAVPTPRKRAVWSVTGESEDEGDAEGGGGSGKETSVGLEDDDVLVAPRGKKRAAARVVTSDSDDDDVTDGGLGSGKDDGGDQGEGVKASKKRGFCGICDSEDEGVDVVTSKAASPTQIQSGEDEDDMVPICRVLKKMRKERASNDGDDEELGEAKGCSTPPTRRSARLVKNQSKRGRAARRVLNFVEPKEYERSEDDMEEDDGMEEFINDEDSSENTSDSAEESCDEPDASGTSVLNEGSSQGPEESDSEVDYADVMARIGRKNKAEDWKFEGDMLAAFGEHPELCLKAVCALYRKQTEEEQKHKATFVHNKQGFNQIHALRGSRIAEFLLDGDLYGPLNKTISDLEEYDRNALGFCRKVASHYSKQLFAIYQNKEDPYFHP